MAVRKPSDSQTSVTGGVMLAAALSLVGAVEYWDAETTYQKQSADPYRIADQAARLEGLRASLPADAILGNLPMYPRKRR